MKTVNSIQWTNWKLGACFPNKLWLCNIKVSCFYTMPLNMAGSNINNRHTFWVKSLTNQPNTGQQIRHVDVEKKCLPWGLERPIRTKKNMMNVVFGILVWVFHKLLPIYWHFPQNRLKGLQWVPKWENIPWAVRCVKQKVLLMIAGLFFLRYLKVSFFQHQDRLLAVIT